MSATVPTTAVDCPDLSGSLKGRGKTLAFIPDDDYGNAYIARMRELFGTFGPVHGYNSRTALRSLLPGDRKRTSLLIINWLENDLIVRSSGRVSKRALLRLVLRTLVMKLGSRRLLFVRHNRQPHSTRKSSAALARRLVDWYERLFDIVITHSGEPGALTDRRGKVIRHYVPHPLYARQEPNVSARRVVPGEYLVLFGRITPYKRIELAIEHFPADKTLVIAGVVADPAYAETLAKLCRPNMVFLPGYMSEGDARELVRNSSGLLVTHASDSVIVSGSFFFALSVNCHVYALATPFLTWIAPRLGADVLTVSEDVQSLCRQVSGPARSISSAGAANIEREFGDAAVVAALSKALKDSG